MDRKVVKATSTVSSNFIDEVTELAESANGNVRKIVEAFHDGKVNLLCDGETNELKTNHEENGYIEPQNTLDHGHIRAHIVEQFVDEGVPRNEVKDRGDGLLSRLDEN